MKCEALGYTANELAERMRQFKYHRTAIIASKLRAIHGFAWLDQVIGYAAKRCSHIVVYCNDQK